MCNKEGKILTPPPIENKHTLAYTELSQANARTLVWRGACTNQLPLLKETQFRSLRP